MKTLLTRIGYNSKFIISGDVEQTDRKGGNNGLQDGITRTKNLKDVGYIEFNINVVSRFIFCSIPMRCNVV